MPGNYNPGQSVSRVVIVDPNTLRDVADLGALSPGERDIGGNIVPTWLPQAFTYDGSNNLKTATVTGDGGTWVRTFTYTNGNQTLDSGWVKQ